MQRDKKLIVIIAVTAAVMLIVAGFFGFKYYKLKQDPSVKSQETTKRLTEKVGKLYSLPSDEQPTIAEVKDKSKLGEQAFFKSAEDGDYILIYTKAQLAILYRESANKMINVGPISMQDQATATTQQPAASPAKVKVLNGTTQSGRAATVGDEITKAMGDKVSVDTNYGNAKSRTVTKTIVVDVHGSKSELAKQIAEAIGGEVKDLPSTEDKPSEDILIITGR